MACSQIYRQLLSLTTFLRVHSNSKEVSYLFDKMRTPNLKTTCHIKLKFFLWTKLLENLLLAKYFISVAAPLMTIARQPQITQNSKFVISLQHLKKREWWSLIFGLQMNIKLSYKLIEVILGAWPDLPKLSKVLQFYKFANLCNISRKKSEVKLIFCANEHHSYL